LYLFGFGANLGGPRIVREEIAEAVGAITVVFNTVTIHDYVTPFMLASWIHDINHAVMFVEDTEASFLLSSIVIDRLSVTPFMLASWIHDINHTVMFVVDTEASFLLSPIIIDRVSVTPFMLASWRHDINHAVMFVVDTEASFLLSPIII
jgi:metal-dependent HD superfamily phosphatase/phosphodiesterase